MDSEGVQNQATEERDVVNDSGSPASSSGVSLADLEPMTTLLVRTANSLYRIVVLRGTTVLIEGGKSFPEITSGDLFSYGLKALRLGWIGLGLRMQIHSGNRCVVTSPVRAFTIEPQPSAGRPQ